MLTIGFIMGLTNGWIDPTLLPHSVAATLMASHVLDILMAAAVIAFWEAFHNRWD